MSLLSPTAVEANVVSLPERVGLHRIVAAWLAARACRRALRELERLDDRVLDDIGLDRNTLRRVLVRRPME